MSVTIRVATPEDIDSILVLIRGLAIYEKAEHEVLATPELLKKNIFDNRYAEVALAFVEGEKEPVGMALYFFNFSTWLAKPGLYLEDLFVQEPYRNKGIGKKLFGYLGKIARERDCGRVEWWVLKWNAPSIAFYKKLGAMPMSEWETYRMEGETVANLEKLLNS